MSDIVVKVGINDIKEDCIIRDEINAISNYVNRDFYNLEVLGVMVKELSNFIEFYKITKNVNYKKEEDEVEKSQIIKI